MLKSMYNRLSFIKIHKIVGIKKVQQDLPGRHILLPEEQHIFWNSQNSMIR